MGIFEKKEEPLGEKEDKAGGFAVRKMRGTAGRGTRLAHVRRLPGFWMENRASRLVRKDAIFAFGLSGDERVCDALSGILLSAADEKVKIMAAEAATDFFLVAGRKPDGWVQDDGAEETPGIFRMDSARRIFLVVPGLLFEEEARWLEILEDAVWK